MGRTVFTELAPRPVGPYSQAIVAGGFVHCSGQLGIDPSTGQLVGATSKEQSRQCLENLKVVLEAAGSSLAAVVKTTIFVTDLDDFKEVNEIYASFFGTEPPARSTVGVARLPLGAKVEIEAVAFLG